MAFVVEDGTGLANSTSYIDVAAADTYHEDRQGFGWDSLATAQKQALLVKATDFLRDSTLFPWRGSKKTAAQALDWPRSGVTEYNGQDVSDTVVPDRVQKATAELALVLSSTELHPVVSMPSAGVKRDKVDVIEREYFTSKELSLDPRTYIPMVTSVMGLVGPLLRNYSGLTDASPYTDNLPPQDESISTTTPKRPFFWDGMHDI